MKKIMFTVVVLVLLAAFGISAFMVVNYLADSRKQAAISDELSEIVSGQQAAATVPGTSAAEATTETTEPTEPGMLPGYKEIYEMNNHTVGWIKIEGTQVDYPVMQTPDEPNFYLNRDFYKEDSVNGSIYAREVCNINEPSDNITIFGHNMASGKMFAELHKYTDKKAWENNSLIFYDTLYEYHTYKIFAVFKTSANLGQGFSYHQFVDAETEEEFDEFVATCKKLAFYDTGITPVYGDKLITLSTCTGPSINNDRLVVVAMRIT